VTVKHRIGIDRVESYDFVCDFVGTVAEAGCRVFMVHARNAWLHGISPKENRELPPLRHALVARLKHDFPALRIVLNGGVAGDEQIALHLAQVDGVMVGRDAYHHPWHMAGWDRHFLGADGTAGGPEREDVEQVMVRYMTKLVADGQPWTHASRHMLGLWSGTAGARRWRQVWSDHHLKHLTPAEVARQATQARLQAVVEPV
jgi:tRNA-dihydrouridine synthase A